MGSQHTNKTKESRTPICNNNDEYKVKRPYIELSNIHKAIFR